MVALYIESELLLEFNSDANINTRYTLQLKNMSVFHLNPNGNHFELCATETCYCSNSKV